MPVVPTALPVTAAAYLRVCTATGIADFICGPQVATVLDDHLGSLSDDVVIGQRGMFLTKDAAGQQIQYEPVHHLDWRVRLAEQYAFTTYVGAVAQPRGVLPCEVMQECVRQASGALYRLGDDVVSVYRGRIAARWTALPEEVSK